MKRTASFEIPNSTDKKHAVEETRMSSTSRQDISLIKIRGGTPLKGSVKVSGAKNSILPLLFSTLLAEGKHEFHNVPHLTDVTTACDLLISLGVSVKQDGCVVSVDTPSDFGQRPAPTAVKRMRAGILCLGPLLARRGEAQLPLPGGCVIGKRPVDLHLKGLEKMGAVVEVKEGIIHGKADKGLKGAEISLQRPTVGGTENLLMSAVLAKGKTCLKNTALEPEIFDLISYLKKMGAKIRLTAPREISIEGVKKLTSPPPHSIIPDRVEAGSLLVAGAITKGEVVLTDCDPTHLTCLIHQLRKCGFILEINGRKVLLRAEGQGRSARVETGYYPDFPTDLQAQFTALMTQLEEISIMKENIFENRFQHIEELKKMGAEIEVRGGDTAYIRGPISLKGADVQATDLRAGAGLILAGLAGEGETSLSAVHHLMRGYDDLPGKLRDLGADIKTVFNH